MTFLSLHLESSLWISSTSSSFLSLLMTVTEGLVSGLEVQVWSLVFLLPYWKLQANYAASLGLNSFPANTEIPAHLAQPLSSDKHKLNHSAVYDGSLYLLLLKPQQKAQLSLLCSPSTKGFNTLNNASSEEADRHLHAPN